MTPRSPWRGAPNQRMTGGERPAQSLEGSSGALLSLSAQQGEDLRGSHQAKPLEAPHPDSALHLCPSPREIPQGLGNPSMVPQPNKESPLEVLPAV